MRYCSETLGISIVKRCAVCNGQFGLVRYYSWRTSLCPRKCLDRLRARRQADRSWLSKLVARESTKRSGVRAELV